jgi:uncharacterized Zn finger protein (UPF0148 family)
MNETQYQCPVCKKPLFSYFGDYMHPNDAKFGTYVVCPHLDCPAQEVAGHGKNEKEAMEVVTDKFKNHVQ